MANQSDIEIRVNVDERDAINGLNNIDSLVENLSTLIQTLSDITETTFSEMDETLINTTDSYDDLTGAVNDNTEATNDNADATVEGATRSKKALGLISGAAKGVGTAFKAMGIGALVALLAALWEALQRNQKVMDAVNVVLETVSIIFNKVTDAVVKAFEKVSEATGGFDAMKTVIVNLIKLGLSPFQLIFYSIKKTILDVQLAWEQSIFGGKDADKIESLKGQIKDVDDNIVKLGESTLEAGKAVINNIGEAVSEVGMLTKTVATDVTQTVKDINISTDVAMGKTLVQMRKHLAELEIQQEATNLKALQQAELQRQIRDDVSKTTDERTKANDALGKILDGQMADEQKILDEKIRIAELELSIDKGNHEKQLVLMRLREVEQAEINERITGQKSEQLVNEQTLIKDANDKILADQKEADDKILADQKEALEKSNEQIAENQAVVLEFAQYTIDEKLRMELDADLLRIENSTLTEEEKYELMMNAYEDYEDKLSKKQDDKLKQDKKDSDELKAHQVSNMKDALAIFSSISSIYSQINSARLEQELSEAEKKHAAELESFVGTEAEREQLIKDQKNEIAQIEYEQAVANKRQKIIDATIEGGLAILASISQLGPIAGPIIGGALMATNLGLILSQDVPPPIKYARGGVLDGKSHADGGIPSPFGELEGGEGVINNVSMANPNIRNIASAANEAGGGVAFGNGAPIHVVMDNVSDISVVLNTNELNELNDSVKIIDDESYL